MKAQGKTWKNLNKGGLGLDGKVESTLELEWEDVEMFWCEVWEAQG